MVRPVCYRKRTRDISDVYEVSSRLESRVGRCLGGAQFASGLYSSVAHGQIYIVLPADGPIPVEMCVDQTRVEN